MITVNKTEKTYYSQSFTRTQIIDLLTECLPDEFDTENLSSLGERQLAEKLQSVIDDCFEVSDYLDSELYERDCGDEWEIELNGRPLMG